MTRMHFTATAVAFAATLAALTAPAARADEDPTKLVTIITSGDPQAQLMGMVLTMQSVQQGAQARILLCGAAAEIALRDAPESATAPQKPKGMSPQGLMKTIIEKTGTKAEVCAIYLPNKGVGAEALIDGVTPAKPDAMAGALLQGDVRILSF